MTIPVWETQGSAEPLLPCAESERFGFEGNEEGVDRAIRYDITLHAFMLSQSGIPVIYSGDEIGMLNDYSYKNDPDKAADSRYLHRGDFRWDLAENRHRPETVQANCSGAG